MSKSLEFCKMRASNPDTSGYADRNWNNAYELDSSELLSHILTDSKQYQLCGKLEDGTDVEYTISVTVDPDGEFDYFTSESYLSDGTALFFAEAMERLLQKVLTLQTWNNKIPQPQNSCTIHWTIGNFVYLNEYDGDWVPKDKEWMSMRTTVLLPLKASYE